MIGCVGSVSIDRGSVGMDERCITPTAWVPAPPFSVVLLITDLVEVLCRGDDTPPSPSPCPCPPSEGSLSGPPAPPAPPEPPAAFKLDISEDICQIRWLKSRSVPER